MEDGKESTRSDTFITDIHRPRGLDLRMEISLIGLNFIYLKEGDVERKSGQENN
jgi:hypothetical protein